MVSMQVGYCFDPHVLREGQVPESLRGLDLIVLPELADGGYAAIHRGGGSHAPGDDFLESLRAASAELRTCIVAGSVRLLSGRRRATNTSLVFHRGTVIHRYDKIHLFRPTGDTRLFVRGTSARTFALRASGGSVRAGVAICFDLRFPELIRSMALQGMRVLVVPARWPSVRDDAWMSLLKARAIENQVFVLGCNSTDGEGGYSYAFGPLGQAIWSNRRRGRQVTARFTLHTGMLVDARRQHDNLKEAVFLKRPRADR